MRRLLVLLVAPVILLCLPLAQGATAGVVVTINKATQRMTVAVGGEARYSWPVSTGGHYSREWDDAPMPHSIFFTSAGHAIHGTDAVRRLGSPASHGCVRLAPGHAAKLFALIQSEGLGSTKIVVTGAEASRLAKHRTERGRRARAPRPDYDKPRYVETYYQYPRAQPISGAGDKGTWLQLVGGGQWRSP